MENFPSGQTVFLYPFSMILTPWFSDNTYGNCKIKIICKNSEKDVRFCDCQYRVYEEINIQNTGGTDYT